MVDTKYQFSFDVASFTRNKVACVHIALPCSSVTFAAGRNGRVLRALDQPWGVDGFGHDLHMKVCDGNRIAKATVDVLTLCLKYKIPVSLENAKRSYLWRLPELI